MQYGRQFGLPPLDGTKFSVRYSTDFPIPYRARTTFFTIGLFDERENKMYSLVIPFDAIHVLTISPAMENYRDEHQTDVPCRFINVLDLLQLFPERQKYPRKYFISSKKMT